MIENLKGQIVMTRGQRTDGTHQYTISVQDELSRCVVIEVNMTPEEFAGALTSLYSTCRIAYFNDSGKIGMLREHRSVPIDCSSILGQHDTEKRLSAARELLAVHEVDGWRGEVRDTENSHNLIRGRPGVYGVRFERWVSAKEGLPLGLA